MDLGLLRAMRAAGIEFAACVEAPVGGEVVTLEPDDVEPLMADPVVVRAQERRPQVAA